MSRGYIGTTGFGGDFDDWDEGFGSPGVEGPGFGSPFAFEGTSATVGLAEVSDIEVVAISRTLAEAMGEEGGYLVEVRATSSAFVPATGYRVDVVDGDGVLHPELEPGCYSAIPGNGSSCVAIANGYIILFALPADLDTGTYAVRITHPSGWVLELPDTITIWRVPWALEIDAIRSRLPPEVYSARGGYPELPIDEIPESP